MRVLIAAGGTAGHINPALAIAGALKDARPDADIHFAGRREGMEYGLVAKAGAGGTDARVGVGVGQGVEAVETDGDGLHWSVL